MVTMDINLVIAVTDDDWFEMLRRHPSVNAIWKQQQQALERQRGPERDFGPSR